MPALIASISKTSVLCSWLAYGAPMWPHYLWRDWATFSCQPPAKSASSTLTSTKTAVRSELIISQMRRSRSTLKQSDILPLRSWLCRLPSPPSDPSRLHGKGIIFTAGYDAPYHGSSRAGLKTSRFGLPHDLVDLYFDLTLKETHKLFYLCHPSGLLGLEFDETLTSKQLSRLLNSSKNRFLWSIKSGWSTASLEN